MTQLEVANFEKEITDDPTNQKIIDLFVDRIMTTIVDNVLEGIGGFVGSTVSWYGANYLMNKYGPFLPKVKDYTHRFQTAA